MTLFTFSNLFAQCPGAMAQTYKNKAMNVTSGNTEEGGAYAGMATYYAYKCECENGTNRDSAQLVRMINSLVDVNVQKYQNRYGTITKVSSCKKAGSAASKANGSENSNITKNTNELGLDEEETQALMGAMQVTSDALYAKSAANAQGFIDYAYSFDKTKQIENNSESFKSNNLYDYSANYNEDYWHFPLNEYVETKILNDNEINIKLIKKPSGKDLKTNDFEFLSFNDHRFSLDKDFEISFEVISNGFESFGFFISNTNRLVVDGTSSRLMNSFTPYYNVYYSDMKFMDLSKMDYDLYNNVTRGGFSPKLIPLENLNDYKKISHDATRSHQVRDNAKKLYGIKKDKEFNNKFYFTNYIREKTEIPNPRKEWKMKSKEEKKELRRGYKEGNYFNGQDTIQYDANKYDKFTIIKKGGNLIIKFEKTINGIVFKGESIAFKYRFLDKKKLYFGLSGNYYNMTAMTPLGAMIRVKNFTIKQ